MESLADCFERLVRLPVLAQLEALELGGAIHDEVEALLGELPRLSGVKRIIMKARAFDDGRRTNDSVSPWLRNHFREYPKVKLIIEPAV